MSNETYALLNVLGSTLCFSSSSIVFYEYSKKISVAWMNAVKTGVTLISLMAALSLLGIWYIPSSTHAAAMAFSGLLGLCIGDLFLLAAYTHLGPARTLMLFGFQPLMLGIAAVFLFGQKISAYHFVAIFFLVLCIFTMSLEKFRQKGHWEMRGLLLALCAITLDAGGVIISRHVFDQDGNLNALHGNLFRAGGAMLGFTVLSLFSPIKLVGNFAKLTYKAKILVLLASFCGTFLSLYFYQTAVRVGHLASLGAVGLSGPMLAALFESLWHKKWPSRYLFLALAFFAIGAGLLLKASQSV